MGTLGENADSKSASLRYGGGPIDGRSGLIRLVAALQRRKTVLLDSDPRLCGQVLAASARKGNFLERLIAVPAWRPSYSIESMDGEIWERLSADFKKVMAELAWRERLAPLVGAECERLAAAVAANSERRIDSETISRLVVRVFFALLFDRPIGAEDETLFFQASIEWRKEIAVKGTAGAGVKAAFWRRLEELVAGSRFGHGLETYARDPARWLSVFAQPLLLSPQINVSDIFVTVFKHLRESPEIGARARAWAIGNDRPRLEGILLEAIRLGHPFPILERELTEPLVTPERRYETGTQFFILLDQFRQDPAFDPERWLKSAAENPYAALPFAAGPRMCVGKPIAMELMTEMLKAFLTRFPDAAIRPEIGHRYSGRDNDRRPVAGETLYQIRVFARVIWRSFLLGFRREGRSTKIAREGCPLKGRFSS